MYALVILLSKAAPERTRGESGIRCIRTRSHPRGALKDTAQVPPSSRAEACVFSYAGSPRFLALYASLLQQPPLHEGACHGLRHTA